MGSVFSPYYALARRRGGGIADPENHCAINVALYGPGGRWAMTERGRGSTSRERERFVVGPSELAWDGTGLTIRFDEVCAPVPKRARGVIRVTPGPLLDRAFAIDGEGRHEWRPVSPACRVEVECEAPAMAWRGDGYLDLNEGAEPLEAAFRSWTWGAAPLGDGAAILYDVERRAGGPLSLGLKVDAAGALSSFEPPPLSRLAPPFWRAPRAAWRDEGASPRVVATLEDAPFYARSRVATRLLGEDVVMMHEGLSLDRFRLPVVQAMLPFRMPRRA